MRSPQIELWWWEGCPSTEKALADLRDAVRELALAADVTLREIETEADAEATGFKGSPTVVIDGTDLVNLVARDSGHAGSGSEEPIGLNCRVYRRRDGRISPTPDPDDLRDALRRAAGRDEEVTR
jgi:hypothetical protein